MDINNILCTLTKEDINRINTAINLISNGFNINELNYKNEIGDFTYRNEVIINFFNSLKPFMGMEMSNIIDKFLTFFMDEINRDK